MLGAVNALVTSGILFCHPNSIFAIYSLIVIPKFLYGLELCDLNKTTKGTLDVAAHTALKYLLNVSKHSLNILNEISNTNNI